MGELSWRLNVSAARTCEKSIVFTPAPPSRVAFSPVCTTKVSSADPPVFVSLPAPPSMVTGTVAGPPVPAPPAAERVSLPPLPLITKFSTFVGKTSALLSVPASRLTTPAPPMTMLSAPAEPLTIRVSPPPVPRSTLNVTPGKVPLVRSIVTVWGPPAPVTFTVLTMAGPQGVPSTRMPVPFWLITTWSPLSDRLMVTVVPLEVHVTTAWAGGGSSVRRLVRSTSAATPTKKGVRPGRIRTRLATRRMKILTV